MTMPLWLAVVLGIVALAALAAAAFALWRQARASRRLEETLERVGQDRATAADVAGLRMAVDARLDTFANQLATTTNTITVQLHAAGDTIASVQQGVGEIRESSARVMELGRNIKRLEEILRPPKARGGVGEVLLENVLGQVLPPGNVQRQFPLGGTTVDFVVTVGPRLVPIDSKFPLESYERLLQGNEEQRPGLRRDFARVVKDKVTDIAAKYIRPDLGTFDFALMYLPSEGIYYEAAIATGDLYEYAAEKRVFPVSPATVYVYLATIALGLKGLALEGKAAAVVAELRRLTDELEKFEELFRVTGKHLRDAGNKYDEAARALGTFDDRLKAVGNARLDAEPAPAPPDEPLLFG